MRRREFLGLMGLVAAGLASGGCSSMALAGVTDLMDGYGDTEVCLADSATVDEAATALGGFGARLAAACDDGEKNLLVSPLSVAMALTLAANGAAGETLAQIEDALGAVLATLASGLPAIVESMGDQLHVANSIWFREGTKVKPEFLAANAQSLDAAAYEAPFDGTTVSAINEWVSQNTSGMIDPIISELKESALLVLVNALALDADWADPYDPAYQVFEDLFTCADGSEQTAEYLEGNEYNYLEVAGATGFVKAYEDWKVGFLGLLPAEGSTPEDVLAALDASAWAQIPGCLGAHEVLTRMPKLSYDWEADISRALQGLGIVDAFDLTGQTADFTPMATVEEDEHLHIDYIAHKTHIDVDEKGTKAAAATAMVMDTTGDAGPGLEEKPYEVYLTRPYVYAIVNLANGAPAFIGVVRSVA